MPRFSGSLDESHQKIFINRIAPCSSVRMFSKHDFTVYLIYYDLLFEKLCLQEFDPEEFYRFLEEAECRARDMQIGNSLPQYILQKLGLHKDQLPGTVVCHLNGLQLGFYFYFLIRISD